MPAPHPAALSDFHLQSAAPNHKFTTPHELLPLQKSQTSEQHLLYADMLPYNTKDLSVTEHGELVGLLEQAVAARPAGCRAACRRCWWPWWWDRLAAEPEWMDGDGGGAG